MSDEDNSTTAERIKWLRERGIQIHIPDEPFDENNKVEYELRVVKIPFDDRLPYEEIVLHAVLGKPGDQCLELLRPYFASDTSFSELDQQKLQAATEQLGGGVHV